jgi:hypothetical protein
MIHENDASFSRFFHFSPMRLIKQPEFALSEKAHDRRKVQGMFASQTPRPPGKAGRDDFK